MLALLDPTTRALGPIYLSQLQGAVLGAPLPLGESILIAWPQMVAMIATAMLLFVVGYVVFQRSKLLPRERVERLARSGLAVSRTVAARRLRHV